MDQRNVTRITTVLLLGFQIPQSITFLAFFLLLLLYCITICGNLLIITLVSYSRTLHSPMYFFLSHLSVLDIILVTDILPNMISTVLIKKTIMSFSDCLAQFYFFVITESSECLLLTVMSWDRYLAICKPLHYTLKMNYQVCWTLVILCWMLGVFVALVYTVTISMLQFCGPDIIDHFFCDFDPILQLSCSDTTAAQFEVTILGVIFVVIPFFIIIVSYAYIISTILKIPSVTGRQKVFSTCSSHLTVVCIYYGTLVCVYLIPNRGQTRDITKLISLLYTVVTPMINPLIYSLRNQELKKVVSNLIQNFLDMHVIKM
ncbi:olfactory receptor 11L1-like [Rana temporaria]|uniref:olfactory receptor 11L1-like n=1 Tax=Rana temporaria TaxID=8407 RepID=UPI001AACCC97|nr:olfactory receptor 11L1-like [Rana temporaria]